MALVCAQWPPPVTRPGREECIARGEAQLSTVLAYSTDALGNPFVAVLLGLAFAAGLLYWSRASMRRVNAEAAEAGLALAAVSLFMRLVLATLALWLYKSFVPVGFKPFAFALAGGFFVMYMLELVRFAGLHRYSRPAGGRQ